jgi:outer membrane protein OmpA-like peptidoglycan-associated protein/archaellum component FlaC
MDELKQLASLLGTADKNRLESLEYRLDDAHQRTQDIATVLPAALRVLADQAEFIEALQAPVDSCVKTSMQQDSRSFVKAILPTMGPLLRRITEEATKPVKDSLQALGTPLSELEKSIKDLEKAYANQYLQMNHLEKQIDELKQAQVNQFNQLHNALQAQQTQLNDLDKFLESLEKAQVNQHLQLSQLDKHFDTLEQTQISQLLKRSEFFAKVSLRFNQLEKRINTPEQRAREIADILPDAIRLASQQAISDAMSKEVELTQSLQTPVEHCIKHSINHDVRPFADALFPVMGPAIRKSINESFKTVLQRINRTLEESVSPKGLAWRMQAITKGISFSEFVLQQTLAYRVEQAFLIHRETGLLIQHSHLEEIDVGDSDAVSAMFTAIQDFTRDSFSASKQEELDSVEIGEYTVWIERGPHAILACVIRGIAPIIFKNNIMRPLLENMHARYGSLLEQFAGDSEPLQPCQPMLQQALKKEEKEPEKRRLLSPQLAIILGIILIAVSVWGYHYFEYQQRLTDYMTALHNASGIVVISTEEQDGKLVVHGMRDPLADDPQQIAQRFELSDNDLLFKAKPYQDFDPTFVELRLRQWLKPPDSVQMSLNGTTLHLSGHANQAWIDKVNQSVGMMGGITEIVADKLTNTEAQFQAFLKTLNNTPGIIVISSGTENGQHFLTGMRDPLAKEPAEIARGLQITDVITDVEMRWTHYQDLTSNFIEKRVRQRLAPPSTVQLRLEGDTLHLSGHASPAWIDKAIDKANTVAGINNLEIKYLLDTDSFLLAEAKRELMPPERVSLTVHEKILRVTGRVDSTTFQALLKRIQSFKNSQQELASVEMNGLVNAEREIRQLIQRIERTIIYFYGDSTGFMPGQEAALPDLLKDVQQLLALSQDLNQPRCLQITGNTDGVGTEIYNRQLSQRRAGVMVNWLQARGIEKHCLIVTLPPKIRFGESLPNPGSRNVSFKVVFKD